MVKNYDGILNISVPDTPYSLYIIYSEDTLDKSIYIGITESYVTRPIGHSYSRKSKRNKEHPVYVWMNNVINIERKNVIFEVIEKEKYNLKDAEVRENEVIEEYRLKGYNVLNVKGNKGRSNRNKGRKCSEEWCNNISISHKGKKGPRTGSKASEETKKKMSIMMNKRYSSGWTNTKLKAVYKYDEDWNLINTFPSATKAAEHVGTWTSTISEWCRGTNSSKDKRFNWSYNLIEK